MSDVRPSFRAGLLVAAVVSSAVFKVALVPRRLWLEGLESFAVETCLLGCIWLVSELVSGPSPVRRIVAALTFYPAFYFAFALHLSHTFYFEEATQRRFSLLDVGPSSIAYFFQHVLPLYGVAAFVLAFALLHAGAQLIVRRRARSLRRPLSLALVPLVLVVAVLLGGAARVPTPVVDIAEDLREVASHTSIRWDEHTQPAGSLAMLDRSASRPRAITTPFDKVIVIVMETMWPKKLDEELRALPPDTFLRSAPAQSHVYTRYFTTNQDSRTSVLGLLGSRFIPHEAYTEEGRDHYLFLSERSSLVDLFQGLGYRTAWAASQSELELVVEDLPWDERLMLTPEEVERAKQTHLCFNPYEFEHSCEDAVLLPKLFDFVDNNERAFVVQQMMWGHASEYNEASGKTNTRYYSEYLDRIVAHLREKGTLDRTLLVVTADHGFREKDAQVDPAFYQVPLMFYAPRFEHRAHDELLCHLELKDLLVRELTLDTSPLREDPFVLIMGTTNSSYVTTISRDELVLMKDRAFASYVVHRAPIDGSKRTGTGPAPEASLKLLHEYRARFAPTHVR